MNSPHTETCPNCGEHFATKGHRAYDFSGAKLFTPVGWDEVSPQVRCPKCGYQSPSTGTRFFGFLTPTQMQIGMAIFAIALCVSALVALFLRH